MVGRLFSVCETERELGHAGMFGQFFDVKSRQHCVLQELNWDARQAAPTKKCRGPIYLYPVSGGGHQRKTAK